MNRFIRTMRKFQFIFLVYVFFHKKGDLNSNTTKYFWKKKYYYKKQKHLGCRQKN